MCQYQGRKLRDYQYGYMGVQTSTVLSIIFTCFIYNPVKITTLGAIWSQFTYEASLYMYTLYYTYNTFVFYVYHYVSSKCFWHNSTNIFSYLKNIPSNKGGIIIIIITIIISSTNMLQACMHPILPFINTTSKRRIEKNHEYKVPNPGCRWNVKSLF